MSKSDKPAAPRSAVPLDRGYQPKPLTEGYRLNPQGGHQPTTGQGAPAKPPSNPPNQNTGGKK